MGTGDDSDPGNERIEGYGAVSSPQPTHTLQQLYTIIGFGKAQVYLWLALSLVAYSDTAELMLISIILPYLQCEWNLSIYFETLLTGSVFFFDALGGIIFGKLSDIYGRRTVLTFTVTIIPIFSIISAMAQNKWQFLILRCIVGLCCGAAYPTTVAYSVEVIEDKYREFGPTVITFVLNLTLFIVAAIAYVCLNLMGWRWYIVIVTIPGFIALVGLRLVPESPRYLSASGDKKGATEAVNRIAEWNGVRLPDDFILETHEDQTLGSIKDVLSEAYRKETILLCLMYFGNMLIMYELIMFLPLALNSEFCGAENSHPEFHCHKLSQTSLRKLLLVTSAGFIAIVAVMGLMRVTGRLIPVKSFAGITFILTLTLYVCFSKSVTMLIFFLIKFAVSGLNLVIWIISSEYYPTVIRSTATGFINTWGKMGGVVGSTMVYLMFYKSSYLVVSLFVFAAVLSLVGAMLWNKETKNVTVQDVILEETQEGTSDN